jgi:hypothetical protein
MTFLGVVVLFPLLFWGLSCGCGLLVEWITGAPIPALLLLPLGFGTLVVVSQFTTWWEPTAPVTPLVLLALALAGFALGWPKLRGRWRGRRGGWWWGIGAAVATYVIVAAPILVAGRVTFTGYLLDTTGAIQIAGAERLLHHAHHFSTGMPAYGTTLAAYFGNGYPSGGHGVLASVGWLSGQDLVWLYSPFQALELSLAALVLVFLARRAGLPRPAAAITGVVASVPALVYAYALMGSIKEITALPMILLMGALMVCARELRARAGIRAVLPFAVAAAAALGAIGIAASPWVALFGAAALLAAVPLSRRREDIGRLLVGGAALAVGTALIALPTVGPLSKTLKLAEGVSSSDSGAVSDPGNLLRPLKFIQTLGVWLGESHRVEPRYVNQTYLLMGVVLVCIALGVVWLLRRRAWSVLVFVAGSLVVWAFLHRHGTTWTDAKLLMLLSPVIVFVALVGAFGVMRTRLFEGLVLVAALLVGVFGSDALLYHGTNLAPTARFTELKTIGARFAGQGPTLAPDFEEYDLYLLRKMDVDIPGVAYPGPFTYVAGATREYGRSYDLDSLALGSVERFKTIVMRRSPAWSRPPSNYSLESSGRYYTVWRRVGPSPLLHIPLGAGFEPSAVPACRALKGVARQAQHLGAQITFAARPINISVNLAGAYHSPSIVESSNLEGLPLLSIPGPGRIESGFQVHSAGTYELWLAGDSDRPLSVFVDGRRVGAVAAETGDDGNVMDVATVQLSAGKHVVRILRGGGDLRPDDTNSSIVDGIVFEPLAAGAERESVQSVAPAAWRSLCGRPLDWIELTRAS